MSDAVNLRRARKQKRRAEKERAAAQNRFAHGRPISEKKAARRAGVLDAKRLEGHRRDPGPRD